MVRFGILALLWALVSPLTASVIAYWSMTESQGTSIKDLLQGNLGRLHNCSWGIGALRFNGEDSFVDLGNPEAFNFTKAFSFELWINPESITGKRGIISQPQGQGYSYRLQLVDGSLEAEVQSSEANRKIRVEERLSKGQWHHVYFVYDSQQVMVYVDGELGAKASLSGDIAASSAPLLLGGGEKSQEGFLGLIDELRVYDHGVAASDIEANRFPYSPWSFIYWAMPQGLTHVSAGRLSHKNQDDFDYWRKRGVKHLAWRGGRCNYSIEHQRDSSDYFVKYWTGAYPEFNGIVIDEIGAGDDANNELLCQSIAAARQANPYMLLAPYCIGLPPQKMIGDLQKADKIQVEIYLPSSRRSYSGLSKKLKQSSDLQISNIAVPTLGIGASWINTATELRRQIHFVRYYYPFLSGISFFNNLKYTEAMLPAFNEIMQGFYSDPVLRLESRADNSMLVQNIGARNSGNCTIKYTEGELLRSALIPSLAPMESYVFTCAGTAKGLSEFSPGCYKIAEPLLYADEPASLRPGAEQLPDTPPEGKRRHICSFADPDVKEEQEKNTTFQHYYYPLGHSIKGNCELSFKLKMISPRYYGNVQLELGSDSGASFMRLLIRKGDYEPAPRASLQIAGNNALLSTAELAGDLKTGSYFIRLSLAKKGFLKALLLDAENNLLWNTGDIPIYDEYDFNRLGIRIVKGEASRFSPEPDNQGVSLKSGRTSAYTQETYISDLSIDCWD